MAESFAPSNVAIMADRKAKLDALNAELGPIEREMLLLDSEMRTATRLLNTEAIHLATCHAEWSAKRAAMIAKFFKEV